MAGGQAKTCKAVRAQGRLGRATLTCPVAPSVVKGVMGANGDRLRVGACLPMSEDVLMVSGSRRLTTEDRGAKRLVITGRVHDGKYRAWTQEQAQHLGVSGWVRNRHDGTVEILAVGAPGAVEQLIAHCWDGPPAADVTDIAVEGADGVAPRRFDVKPTV